MLIQIKEWNSHINWCCLLKSTIQLVDKSNLLINWSLKSKFIKWTASKFKVKLTHLNFQQVKLLDPSDIYRPDLPTFAHKGVNQFRDFTVKEDDPITQRIFKTYVEMHTNQTVDFVKSKNILSIWNYNNLISDQNYQYLLKQYDNQSWNGCMIFKIHLRNQELAWFP